MLCIKMQFTLDHLDLCLRHNRPLIIYLFIYVFGLFVCFLLHPSDSFVEKTCPTHLQRWGYKSAQFHSFAHLIT